MSKAPEKADAIIVGAGLAGLVAACELIEAEKSVILLDQEPDASLGGQAFWSLGGLFLVNSPEQRRVKIKDSLELAWQDWVGTAGFDRAEDEWPRRWARAYVEWAAGGKREWIRGKGLKLMPQVGWAERGGYDAQGHGNSVPRFHVTWGTGPGVLAPFERTVRTAIRQGKLTWRFRHRVDELVLNNGCVTGVRGEQLEPSRALRGQKSSRIAVGSFEFAAESVIVTSGGIGGNHELVRNNWPSRLGSAPKRMLSGVPDHVDGRMLGISAAAGASVINADRMWHYTEGIQNWDSIWPNHGIRIIPGPSSLWLDATGSRLPVPLFPGFDTLGTLEHIVKSGYEHTWYVLTRKIIEKEFALSGSEQNPDITGRDLALLLKTRLAGGPPGPVQAFMDHGVDFVVKDTVAELAAGMNALTDEPLIDADQLEQLIVARDREVDNPFCKDLQVSAINAARQYKVDRLTRVAEPHRLLDRDAGPLIAVKLSILTRKSLGGLQTDLGGRVLDASGSPLPGLYAAGEVCGFGGGGLHGYRALEGTFLGGCLFSGKIAGETVAAL